MAKRKKSDIDEGSTPRGKSQKKSAKSATRAPNSAAKSTLTTPTPRGRRAKQEALRVKCKGIGAEVLNIAELLETVLEHLPLEELFANKRVCKTWRDCIRDSPTLKKVMWLEPEGMATAIPHPEYPEDAPRTTFDGTQVTLNPLFALSLEEPLDQHREIAILEKLPFSPIRAIVMPPRTPESSSAQSSLWTICMINRKFLGRSGIKGNKLTPTSSWRNMLVSQPAIRRGALFGSDTLTTEEQDEPLLLGELYDYTSARRSVWYMELMLPRGDDGMEGGVFDECTGHARWENGLCGCMWYSKHGLE